MRLLKISEKGKGSRIQGKISFIISKIFRQLVILIDLKRLIIVCFPKQNLQVTKFNLVTDLQIMLPNVTHSHFNSECNTERGCIDQLYIELGPKSLIYNILKFCYLIIFFPKTHPSFGWNLNFQLVTLCLCAKSPRSNGLPSRKSKRNRKMEIRA